MTAARRFVVIVSADKPVPALTAPVPLELLTFGIEHTLELLAPARLRDAPPSPDGGLIADYMGDVGDPAELAARLDATPGLVGHGLFGPELVSLVLVGEEGGAEPPRRREGLGRPSERAPARSGARPTGATSGAGSARAVEMGARTRSISGTRRLRAARAGGLTKAYCG